MLNIKKKKRIEAIKQGIYSHQSDLYKTNVQKEINNNKTNSALQNQIHSNFNPRGLANWANIVHQQPLLNAVSG